jgi:hypothetical protein
MKNDTVKLVRSVSEGGHRLNPKSEKVKNPTLKALIELHSRPDNSKNERSENQNHKRQKELKLKREILYY